MKNGHLISEQEFELLEAAKLLTKAFGLFHGKLVTPRGQQSKAQDLLT